MHNEILDWLVRALERERVELSVKEKEIMLHTCPSAVNILLVCTLPMVEVDAISKETRFDLILHGLKTVVMKVKRTQLLTREAMLREVTILATDIGDKQARLIRAGLGPSLSKWIRQKFRSSHRCARNDAVDLSIMFVDMSYEERAALLLRMFANPDNSLCTSREIGQILGISKYQVDDILRRAKHKVERYFRFIERKNDQTPDTLKLKPIEISQPSQ